MAVLLVVLFHAGVPVPGGFTGVDVFFAISGFVIAGTLLTELTSTGRIRFLGFYARRIKRLLPALALMITVVAVLGTLAAPVVSQKAGAVTGAFASLFAANAYLYRWDVANSVTEAYFGLVSTLNPFLHTWTLGVEEQFYLIFPVLLFAGWRLAGRTASAARSRLTAAFVVGTVSAASFLVSLTFSRGGEFGPVKDGASFAFYSSPTRAWEFGFAVLLALGAPLIAGAPHAVATALGVVGVAMIGTAAVKIHGSGHFPGTAALLPVGGACALIAAGTIGPNLASRVLSMRPAVWIGDLSYSWYLWHWPLIVYAKALWPDTRWVAPVAAALSLLPAWGSYRFVENPIRLNPRLAGRRVVALAAVCIVVPLAASAGLVAAHKAFSTTPDIASFVRSKSPHADEVRGCNNPLPLGKRQGQACNWDVPGSTGRVVLFGDSNAGHFTEPVVSAANRAGLDATVVTFNSCPAVDVRLSYHSWSAPDATCRVFETETLRALVRLKPSLVIVASQGTKYVEGPAVGLGGSGTRGLTYRPDAKARLWKQGTESVVSRLNRAGIPVLVVNQVPPTAELEDCAVLRVLLKTCALPVARSTIDRQLRRSLTAERAAVTLAPMAWTINFENTFCDKVRCTPVKGSTHRYLNSTHLSVAGALELTDDFYRAIVAHRRRQSP